MPVFWGMLGAFMYAGQRLILCIRTSECSGKVCVFEFCVSLVVGCIAAAAFTPFVATTMHRTAESDMVAIASILGLLANRLAPSLVEMLVDRAAEFIGGRLGMKASKHD